MCNFVSWIETPNGDFKYLTNKEIRTKQWQNLLRLGKVDEADKCGHYAIRQYFRIPDGMGENKECTAFSKPSNFPEPIVVAIKAGKMRGMGVAGLMLNEVADAKYRLARDKARAECMVAQDKALAECMVTQDKAWAEWDATCVEALDEYRLVRDKTFWDLFSVTENRADEWR